MVAILAILTLKIPTGGITTLTSELSHTVAKIAIECSRVSLIARVSNLPNFDHLIFNLIEDGKTIETSAETTSNNWEPKVNLTNGTYIVECEIVDNSIITQRLSSMKIRFGQNLQNLKPRKARPVHPHRPAASFRNQIHLESRKAFRSPNYTAWLLDIKTNTYQFANLLGLNTPALELKAVPLAQLPLEYGTVVKPLTGVMSQGVYLIDQDRIIDLPNNQLIGSIDDLRASMQSKLDSGQVRTDHWIRERLIRSDHAPHEPARDLKFYSFYGRVHLALETVRSPEVVRCWYDISQNRIDTGKYTNNLFPGNGIPAEYFEVAELISSRVPAPFARIDLLASPDGPVVNEITPKPGGSHLFADSVDAKLGDWLAAADARLRIDLLNGKQFSEFHTIRRLHMQKNGN